MIDIGIYEVKFDETTNQFVLNDQLGQRGEIRRDLVREIVNEIEFDIDETSAGIGQE